MLKQVALIQKLQAVPEGRLDEMVQKIKVQGEHYNMYALSPEQQRMFFIQNYTEYGKYAYICPYEIQVDTKEKADLVKEAIQKIVENYESLRTLYFSLGGHFFQTICAKEEISVPFRYENWTKESEERTVLENKLQEWIDVPFDLEKELPIRCLYVKKTESAYSIYVVMHHICHDAWSIGLLMKNLDAYMKGKEINVEKVHYIDYVNWRNSASYQEHEKEQLEYWKNHLNEEDGRLPLERMEQMDSSETHVGDVCYELSASEDCQLKKYLTEKETTPSNFFAAISMLALMNFFKKSRIHMGTVTFNRDQTDFFNTFGFFSNTVVLSGQLNDTSSFDAYLKKVSMDSLQALAHQEVSFDKIVDAVCQDRNSDQTPLFQAIFLYYGQSILGKGDKKYDFDFLNLQQNKYALQDLVISVEQYTETTKVVFTYDTDKLEKEWAERLLQEFKRLVTAVLSDSSISMAALKKDGIYSVKKTTASILEEQYSPNSEISEKLVEILEEVLEIHDFSYDQSFFQLGCNSINSIILLEKVNRIFSVDCNVAEIMQYSTVNRLSGYLAHKKGLDQVETDILYGEF